MASPESLHMIAQAFSLGSSQNLIPGPERGTHVRAFQAQVENERSFPG